MVTTGGQDEASAAADASVRDRDRRNRDFWNARSDAYQREHGDQLAAHGDHLAWGVWSLPDAELGVLDEVAGTDVLEVGCGAGHAAVALARQGARVVGLDLAERQLAHAVKLVGDAGVDVRLVQGSAEVLPFKPGSFDLVFCDHGAIGLAQPERAVAEAARVLRRRGVLAFLVPSSFTQLAWSRQTGRLSNSMHRPYFGLGEDGAEVGGPVPHQRGYGEWVRLFATAGLAVEDLVEVRPPLDAETSYRGFAQVDWARKYPAEIIWKLRKGQPKRRRPKGAPPE